MTQDLIIVVHARGGSERIPNKALKVLGDKPLIFHSLDTCIQVKARRDFNIRVVVDSDSEEILEACRKEYGENIEYLKRPKALATNRITGDDLMYWQAENYPDSYAIIQKVPTSPFLSAKTLHGAIADLKRYNSVVGVRKEALYTWVVNKPFKHKPMPTYFFEGKIPNSQDLEPTIFETTGLYALRTEKALDIKSRICYNSVKLRELSKIESLDINVNEDFKLAELVWKGMNT